MRLHSHPVATFFASTTIGAGLVRLADSTSNASFPINDPASISMLLGAITAFVIAITSAVKGLSDAYANIVAARAKAQAQLADLKSKPNA